VTQPTTFRRHLCFFIQLSHYEKHMIVGYQRQRMIHLCCLQKSIRWRYLRRRRWRYLRRQEVKLTLTGSEANIGFGHALMPTLDYILWRQLFKCSDAAYVCWSRVATELFRAVVL